MTADTRQAKINAADDADLAELDAWAGSDRKRLRFIKSLWEYFDLCSCVLIVRALEKSKIAQPIKERP